MLCSHCWTSSESVPLQPLEKRIYRLLHFVCIMGFGLCHVNDLLALCFKTKTVRMHWKKNPLLLRGMGSKILSTALLHLRSWHPVHPFERARAITVQWNRVLSHDLSKSAFDNAVIPSVRVPEHWNGISTLDQSRMHFCALPSIWKNPLVQAVDLTRYRCLKPVGIQPSSRCECLEGCWRCWTAVGTGGE